MKQEHEVINLVDDEDEKLGAAAKEQQLVPVVEKQRVAKYFEDERLYFGTVTQYFEPDVSNGDLWRISYDDGDAEDMNQWELYQAIQLYKQEGASLDHKKAPPRQTVTPSPVFSDAKMENVCDELDEEVEVMMVPSASTPARKRHLFLSDDEDNESANETTPNRLGKIKSLRARKKYARLEQKAWLGDETDSDEDDMDIDQGFPVNRRRRRLHFGIPPLPPVALTQAQQQDMLAAIEKSADKALQKLLINQEFQFQLLPRQFFAFER